MTAPFTGSGVRIRPMIDADRDAVVAVSLAADALLTATGLDLPPDDPGELLAHVDTVLVAGDPAVGAAMLTSLDGRVHLEQLAVHPDHGRRGVGSALLEAVWRHAEGPVTLTTFRDVAFNGPFYARRGYTEFPREQWGPDLHAQWAAEEAAGIMVAPRLAMIRRS